MRFWDSSALVPLLVDESSSQAMRELLADDPDVVIWMFSGVEVLSAIGRLARRSRELDDLIPSMRADALDLIRHCSTVTDADAVRRRSERLIGVHPLAAADTLQLAAALTAADDRPETLEFVTLDRVLAQRASLEGFRVRPQLSLRR